MQLLKDQPMALEKEVAPAKMFDGRFFITNPFDFDYTCKWNGVEYEFKAMTTSPLLIEDATPLQTQSIRRKFAADMGAHAYFLSKDFVKLSASEKQTQGRGISNYLPLVKRDNSGNEVWDEASPIAPYALKCLEPLPVVVARVGRPKKRQTEQKIDPKTNRPIITVMDHTAQDSQSLVEEAARL